MKVLLVHPGASWSTHDVWAGLYAALRGQGTEIVEYALDGRIQFSGGWLTWCWKHGGKKLMKPTQADILYQASSGAIERALRHRVDWVLIVSGMYFHPDVIVMLRQAGLRVGMLFTESPYDDEWQMHYAPWCNMAWVNERASVAKFREVQPETFYYQHAMDPGRHGAATDDAPDVPAHDVVFVGTGFQERVDLLAAIDWTGIDLGLYGSWALLGSRHPLRQHLRNGVTPNAMTAALYRRAKVGLNLHRSSIGFGRDAPRIAYAESMGPRCYELGATGTFFISDHRAELREVYGDAVPTFTDAREAEMLIRDWLGRGAERQVIARQLPQLVAPHTFEARAREMLGVLEAHT